MRVEKMTQKEQIDEIIKNYDKKNISIVSFCSHSSLQIFKGAADEGFKTIGLLKDKGFREVYDAFDKAAPDEFIEFEDLKSIEEELIEKNAIIIPSGSFVEYFGEKIMDLNVPFFGNRKSLEYEKNRLKMYSWLKKAGIKIPDILEPSKIDRPCIVKHSGAKGGRGYSIVHSPEEYYQKYGERKDLIVQEFIVGVRMYPHYFYSPIFKQGYKTAEGTLELLSIDRRIESNIDESYRTFFAGIPIKPSFSVVGNEAIVIRESLLENVLRMGRNVVEAAYELFGPIPGPFCLELVCNENLEFYAFEISARIVAGTNLFIEGSPYSALTSKHMSTGRRIAYEIKHAIKKDLLQKILY